MFLTTNNSKVGPQSGIPSVTTATKVQRGLHRNLSLKRQEPCLMRIVHYSCSCCETTPSKHLTGERLCFGTEFKCTEFMVKGLMARAQYIHRQEAGRDESCFSVTVFF